MVGDVVQLVRTLPSSRLESYTVTANSLHYSTERTRNRRICIYKGCLSRVLLMQGGRLNRSLGSSRSATELRPLVVPNCTRGIYDPRSGFNPCRAPATSSVVGSKAANGGRVKTGQRM